MNQTTKAFNASTVSLAGSNLIEASAGTGKTYSIAILVLRLILEQRLSVKQILMVTFTKAAVAELETRIRLFVRCAYQASLGVEIGDDTIASIVQRAAEAGGKEQVQQDLKGALLLLDETSVMTIHSFCQQALLEFAFETKQVFGAETMQDANTAIQTQMQHFWRKHVTTIPAEALARLVAAGLSMELLQQIMSTHLGGKHYLHFDPAMNYDCANRDYDTFRQAVDKLQQELTAEEECLRETIRQERNDLFQAMSSDRNGQRYVDEAFVDEESIIQFLRKHGDKKYVERIFKNVLPQFKACNDITAQIRLTTTEVLRELICAAIQFVTQGLARYKQQANVLTFDDMIVNLHRALTQSDNHRLVAALRNKYKAVFVDEFQDTDRAQYEIFLQAFAQETILFYIGDPKQSIYAWRKADVFTYFEARNGVDNVYEMNVNYRSAARYIAAMNEFFDVDDPFHFKGMGDAISYIPVESPEENRKGDLLFQGQPDVPLSITSVEAKGGIIHALVAQVLALLSNQQYTIRKGDTTRPVVPADIGVLVHYNRDAAEIRNCLAAVGVPAVTIGDEKVLDSQEAPFMWYLLLAMREPTPGNINRALLSPFTGFTTADIPRLDVEKVMEQFRKYEQTWTTQGIYKAISEWMHDFGIHARLLHPDQPNGERILTNLLHLTEMLHKTQNYRNLSALELTAWLKRAIDGLEVSGDEYEQRMDRDEAAVKIITVHKSKGLEYNIILAHKLELVDQQKATTRSFRDDGSQRYLVGQPDDLTPAQQALVRAQNEQEYRRLIYVAVTRAVYKCFVYKKVGKGERASALTPFFYAARNRTSSLINFPEPLPQTGRLILEESQSGRVAAPRKATDFSLREAYWQKMSYTGLAAKGEGSAAPPAVASEHAYDQFVFKDLTRGAQTGNLLHYIFENISFQSSQRHTQIVDEAVSRYAWKYRNTWPTFLLQMIQEVLEAPITVGNHTFTLDQVRNLHRLHELEFDFLVPNFNPGKLSDLSDDRIRIRTKSLGEIDGLMNGKMDLFFEHEERFYILDWKSNYLGAHLADYEPDRLLQAMNDHNYHLQYLLYTLAACKFLRSRLGAQFDYKKHFGGVIYLFLRGIRKSEATGIFTCLPSASQIEKLEKIVNNTWIEPSVPGLPLPDDWAMNSLQQRVP